MTAKTGATRTYSNAVLSIVVLLIQWDSNKWIPAQLIPQLNSETGTSTFIRTTSKTNQQRAISQLGKYILHWTTPTSCSQNPNWWANSPSHSHDIRHLIWKLNAHYHVQNNPPMVHTLIQKYPIKISPMYAISSIPVFHLTFWMRLLSSQCALHDKYTSPSMIYNNVWWATDIRLYNFPQHHPLS